MEKYEIVIVGAGPGGLKAAEVLAKNNKKVLVLEKNKIIGDKVCAGGLTLHCLGLGIPKKILQREFNNIKIHTPNQTSKIKLDETFIYTVDRKDLGKFMANSAKRAGAEIRTKNLVTKIKKDLVITKGGQKIKFKYLIGADGAYSIVRNSLGLNNKKILSAFQYIVNKKFKDLELFFNVDKFGPAYAWIFPYKKTTSIGVGADLTKSGQKFLKLIEVRKNFDKWCKDKFDIKEAKLESHIINYDYQGFKFKNKFLIGDAGGFSSGLTGEGIYFAMLSGIDIAYKIINKKYRCTNIEHILRVKNFEEKILKSFEINKNLTKIELEFLILLFKTNIFNKELIKIID